MLYKVDEIKRIIQATEFIGDSNSTIKEILAITDAGLNENSICWCSDKNSETLKSIKKTNIIVSQEAYANFVKTHNPNLTFFVVENPRRAFALLMNHVAKSLKEKSSIHASAIIHPSAKLNGKEINIGANVVIESDVQIDDNVSIGANTTILSRTQIKSGVIIGCNSTIGGVGFGYEMNDESQYELIPHIGNVVIEKNVEIGNNVCIDRAVLGSTKIGENVKIDNLVHIAHGVQIGANSLIIANAMIAGSCEIGENVWVSPSVSIMQKVKIGNNSLIGMGSVVLKNVEPNSVVAGVPAKKIKDR